MTKGIVFSTNVHFSVRHRGRKQLETGTSPAEIAPSGRVPWVSKYMALAIRFEGLLRAGTVTDQAELARLGHVSRARVTQIMNLLHLAPDIQEELLFISCVKRGNDPILERHLRPIAAIHDWRKQRAMWNELKAIVK